MRRYDQLADIIAKIKPQSIVEIGVHRAVRACYMVGEALRYQPEVSYLGFDIFERADEEFHQAALNGKGIPEERKARRSLHGLQRKIHMDDIKRRGAERSTDVPIRFNWKLTVGDTRKTLAGREVIADLVFIDGDHRVETIRSDYAAVRESRCVVFDDYLLPGRHGELPDLDIYGANRIVDEIPEVRILPITDRAKQGWKAAFAVVEKCPQP